MQLTRRLGAAALPLAALFALSLAPRAARAQVAELDTSHSIYYESPFRTNMLVYSPAASLSVTPAEPVDVRAGWEADVVSGASVAVKAGPAYQATHPAADVVTTASVHDLRNVARGGFTLRKETVSLTGDYAFSTEHDYRSHSLNVSAKTELFDHNTQLEINYARNFDSTCDRVQSTDDAPARFRALEDSTGCFTSEATRTTRSIGVDGLQGGWSQAWSPVFATQLVYTAQITSGFQSNPYRSVILGEGLKAQERHPENRAREGLALRGNFYLRPIRAALRLGLRGYWDTWDVKSVTAEAEVEKYLTESLRIEARGRFYKQSGALFWSDDYTGGDRPLGPRGQYWTGDRELSPFTSGLLGLRLTYTMRPEHGRLLGLMTTLKLAVHGSAMQFSYDEYTLGGSTISNARAYLGGLALSALF